MKKRNSSAMIIDSMIAVVQTILFALVPEVFPKNVLYQGLSYVGLLAVELVYIFLLRKKIIDAIVVPKGVSTTHILSTNYADIFHRNILNQVREIKNSNKASIFDEYFVLLTWEETANFIIQHFWDMKPINIVLKEETKYSKNKIYKDELYQIIEILLAVYNECNEFSASIKLFQCRTRGGEVKMIHDYLIVLKDELA